MSEKTVTLHQVYQKMNGVVYETWQTIDGKILLGPTAVPVIIDFTIPQETL